MTSRKSSRGRYSIQASLCAKVDLQYFERQSLYFAEMGMSPDLFPLMLAHQLKGVYRLSSAEITKTLLSGFDKHHTEFIKCYKETLREPFLNWGKKQQ